MFVMSKLGHTGYMLNSCLLNSSLKGDMQSVKVAV